MNIVDELIRIKAFNSKSEARTMIKNRGVSLIPCVNEDFETPCFEATDFEKFHEVHDIDVFNTPKWWTDEFAKTWMTGSIKFWPGFILAPDGTKIPATKWDVSIWKPVLARFIENLVNGTKKGVKIDNRVITWDIDQFGKNPWLLTDEKLEVTIKTGDVIKIGKNRTIVVE